MVEMMHLAGIPSVALVGVYRTNNAPDMAHQWNGIYINDTWILADGTHPDFFDVESMKNTHIAQEVMDVTLKSEALTMGYFHGLAVVASDNPTVIIPETFQNLPITAISYRLFSTQSNVQHVTISKNITYMDISTLKSSWKIKSITVEEGNPNYSSWEGVLFSADKKELLVFPAGNQAETFTLPKEIITLDLKDSFGSQYLQNIYVEEGNPAFSSYDGALYNANKSLLQLIPSKKTSVTIYNDASIGDMAFAFVDSSKLTVIAKAGSKAAEYAQQHQLSFQESHQHTMTFFPAKEATCKEEGTLSHYRCDDCSLLYEDENGEKEISTENLTIPITDHSFGNWTITTPATCKEEGVESRSCSICQKTEVRPASSGLLDHSFGNWTIATAASCEKDGTIQRNCTVCKEQQTQSFPKIATVTLQKTSFSYTGKQQTAVVLVKDEKQQIIPSEYYTVSGNTKKNPGKYTITITFSGKYIGSVTKTFEIQPPKTSISKVKATKNTITLNWKPQKSGIKGYKIQYTTDKKFKKNVKTVTIKKAKTTKTTLKKLKSKKKYYIRICTYKGNIQSKWSKGKSIRTK